MQGLLSDNNSKQDLEDLKSAFKAYTVNGQVIARVNGSHVILGQIKENKVFLNDLARSLLESIPKMSMPMVPVGVVHVTKDTIEPNTPKVETTPSVERVRKPRAPRKPKEVIPEESFDLSGLDDLK